MMVEQEQGLPQALGGQEIHCSVDGPDVHSRPPYLHSLDLKSMAAFGVERLLDLRCWLNRRDKLERVVHSREDLLHVVKISPKT